MALEIESMLISGLINVLFFGIGAYVVYKIVMLRAQKIISENTKIALDQVKLYAETWLNSDTGKKAIFEIGQIVGAGAKQSITGKSAGGKWGWLETILGFVKGAKSGDQAQKTAEPQGLN